MAGASPHRAFLARFSCLRVSRRPRGSTTRHYALDNLGYEQYRERKRPEVRCAAAGRLRSRYCLARRRSQGAGNLVVDLGLLGDAGESLR
jgi:hypothetical protein